MYRMVISRHTYFSWSKYVHLLYGSKSAIMTTVVGQFAWRYNNFLTRTWKIQLCKMPCQISWRYVKHYDYINSKIAGIQIMTIQRQLFSNLFDCHIYLIVSFFRDINQRDRMCWQSMFLRFLAEMRRITNYPQFTEVDDDEHFCNGKNTRQWRNYLLM